MDAQTVDLILEKNIPLIGGIAREMSWNRNQEE